MINNNDDKFFTISSTAAPKFDFFSIQNNGENMHVYDACIIRLLSQVFRLPYKILLPSDGEFGRKLPDGNWTGIMGMVYRSEIDIGISLTINYPRFQAVKFSYPYFFSDITFMTDKPKPAPTSLALLHPFPPVLWILLIAAIFLFSCVLFLYVYRKQTYQNILFMLFGSLLEKSIDIKLRKLSLKLIISSWFIFTFVIINSYKAVLLSFLTLPFLIGIRDIPDLAKAAEQNFITCYSYKGTSKLEILLESESVAWRSIGKCLQSNDMTSEDAELAFIKAPSNKAFITSRSYLRPFEEMFFISKDSFYNSMRGFSISRKFCCQSDLDEKIHRLFAAGLFQKIDKDEQFIFKSNVTSPDSIEQGTVKILLLDDMKGAFIVLFSGYVLSTIVLFIELTGKRYFSKSNVTSVL